MISFNDYPSEHFALFLREPKEISWSMVRRFPTVDEKISNRFPPRLLCYSLHRSNSRWSLTKFCSMYGQTTEEYSSWVIKFLFQVIQIQWFVDKLNRVFRDWIILLQYTRLSFIYVRVCVCVCFFNILFSMNDQNKILRKFNHINQLEVVIEHCERWIPMASS